MTLQPLLDELKRVDRPAWNKLVTWNVNMALPETSPLSLYIIQGVIQRACEKREWHWTIMKDPYQDGYRAEIAVVSESHLSDHICIDDLAIKCATSPAEALLAAYIAAVREEAKR